jgi:hypothetical protein
MPRYRTHSREQSRTHFHKRFRRFLRGELHFDADYIRGRRVKTHIVVRSNGTCTIETVGRGKAALRWLERLRGKKHLQVVSGHNA